MLRCHLTRRITTRPRRLRVRGAHIQSGRGVFNTTEALLRYSLICIDTAGILYLAPLRRYLIAPAFNGGEAREL